MRYLISTYSLLFVILISGFFLRFYNINTNPPSLNWDEVAIGYNAYSIIKTGHDEWGEWFPTHFKSYGEYKLPVQIYLSIPGIALFGLTELGVRITPVIYGTLTILVLFFLTQELFKNRYISLITAFLLAISPWHVQLTRASFESSFSVFWVLLGIWFLVKGFSHPKWFIVSTIPFAISIYTYNAARVFTPLFLFAILIFYWKALIPFRKQLIISALIFAILMIPLLTFFLKGEAFTRYKLVSITNEAGLIPRIEEARNNSELPGFINKLVNNQYTYISYYFVLNYLAHFSPQFLFISGASHVQHHVQGIGELYLFQAPFVLLGLLFLIIKKEKYKYLLFAWLLIAFIPVSTTFDSIPNALRTVIAAPVYQIFTAIGLYYVFVYLQKRKRLLSIFVIFISILTILNIYKFTDQLFVQYPKNSSRDWQYGYKQVVAYINQYGSKYDRIIMTNEYGQPYMFVLFYTKYDPIKFQNDETIKRSDTSSFIKVESFNKYIFDDLSNENSVNLLLSKYPNSLFIGRSHELLDQQILKKIDFSDGKNAFIITTNK